MNIFTLKYQQGCQLLNQGGWTIERDASNKYGFYAHKDDLWITFDDAVIARNKAIYIRQNKLFGAAIGTLDEDDEDNHCGGGKHPILQEIDNIFTFVLDIPVISSSTEGKTSPNIETYEANNTSPPTIIRPTVSRNVSDRANGQICIEVRSMINWIWSLSQ